MATYNLTIHQLLERMAQDDAKDTNSSSPSATELLAKRAEQGYIPTQQPLAPPKHTRRSSSISSTFSDASFADSESSEVDFTDSNWRAQVAFEQSIKKDGKRR